METYGDSGKEEDKQASSQLVERSGRNGRSVRVGTSGVLSSSVSLRDGPRRVIAPRPCSHRTIKQVKIPSNEVQGFDLGPPEQDGGFSEWEEKDEIPLSQLRERLRNDEGSKLVQIVMKKSGIQT